MGLKICFLSILLFSPYRIVESTLPANSDLEMTNGNGSFGMHSATSSDMNDFTGLSDEGEESLVPSGNKKESDLSLDELVLEGPELKVTTKKGKKLSKKQKVVLGSISGSILLAMLLAGLIVTRRYKRISELDRKALDADDRPLDVTPEKYKGIKDGLLKAVANLNKEFGLADGTPDALNATIQAIGASRRDTIVKQVKGEIEKDYGELSKSDIQRLKSARQYLLNEKIIPTLELVNPEALTITKDNINQIILRLEGTFNADLSKLKVFLNQLDGTKYCLNFENVAILKAPLEEALKTQDKHPDYDKGMNFLKYINEAGLNLYLLNNAVAGYSGKLEEYVNRVQLPDETLIAQLSGLQQQHLSGP